MTTAINMALAKALAACLQQMRDPDPIDPAYRAAQLEGNAAFAAAADYASDPDAGKSAARFVEPAFACHRLDGNQPGMSTHLYIATVAMGAILVNCWETLGEAEIARLAYRQAIAMIAEDAK